MLIKMYHKLNYVPKLGDDVAYVSYLIDNQLVLLVVKDLDTIPSLRRAVLDWFISTYRPESRIEVVSVRFTSPDDFSNYFDINLI